ncbi:MAG: c-type cytochrome [Gemmatimonadetes bacterium]|nr:c-type cytochrome [Gemmatimonadota bacterium]
MTLLRTISLAALSGIAVPALLAAQGGRGMEPPKNLQVLPKDTPRPQVVALMQNFTAALGVRCEHCHAAAEGAPAAGAPGGGRGGPPLDFAADTKDEKKIAREMLKMVMDINGKYLPLTGRTITERNRVSCETCHHGLVRPQTLRAALANAVDAKGADSATALYRDLRTKYYGTGAYDFGEFSLPRAAMELAQANQRPAALALLKLNLEFYDKSAPTYQTMAQISLAGGDTAAAVAALKKAVELQPNNPQLQGMLQRLAPKP